MHLKGACGKQRALATPRSLTHKTKGTKRVWWSAADSRTADERYVSQPPAMRSFTTILSLAGLFTVAMMCGCGSPMFNTTAKSSAISVSPSDTTAWAGDVRQMKAIVANSDATAVIWSTTSGTISPTGLLSIPATIGDTVITVTA